MLSSAVVDVTPSSIFNSAVVEVTPSKMFISVAVAVTATSSFIFGLVNVLLVSVCVAAIPVIVSVLAGKVNVMFPEKAECAGACNLA